MVDSRRGVRRRLVAALLCPPTGDHSACRGVYAIDNGSVADGVRPLRCGGSGAKVLVTLCYLPSRVFFALDISLYGRVRQRCDRSDFIP
jgi:hypothetical protein